MKLWNVELDIIALSPERLALEKGLSRLPEIAVLILALVIIVALIIRRRRQ